MTKEQFEELKKDVGDKIATDIKSKMDNFETAINQKYEQLKSGLLSADEFKKFKDEELDNINKSLSSLATLEKAVKDQGDLINEMKKGESTPVRKSMEEWFDEQMPSFKELRSKKSGEVEFSAADLRKAGVVGFTKAAATTSVSGSVQSMDAPIGSPYLPGLGNETLQLFEIVRNPNFIVNRVNVGRTNQFRLAWINETDYQGLPDTNIAEGGTKPQVQHIFKVEMSTAKKAAAWMELTEEFEDDLPGLATAVRRMLQNDVMREFDNAIQAAVIAVARPFEITGLDAKVPFTTLFDAIGALLAQVGFYNFIPNTVALNPVTDWTMLMDKDAQGRYLNPPFLNRINALLVDATKVAVGYGLVGDLSQYNVDIYKDFSLRIGWINDEFIKNKFAILGELRYHNYISDSRKKAIVYNNLAAVQQKITAGS